ncbi:type IV toxin-antitoxin system AbiEi family antitoxin domain-containing protein [Sulfurimonas sp.]|uniref:type IV toxin-antitoxin system AbiEi family antitoxin domain-containing protein n=1 Tax=Sulfurimonas sp. TaxID=2022749 RepID=UPI002631F0C7|nr:type IV toxin-antitoxin system AbiEi family antitoxin domain-containing protein [Sulfurimonas sp.]MDD5156815.1 type IV toxin-antitoxin system AbiEi family antitoxin domain-containing protein [Sulfurimonas sp.]
MSTMTIQNNTKLKQLYELLPSGVVVSASWLEKNGISRQLRYEYVNSGWLHTLGKSAYIQNPKNYTWQGLVVGIQSFMELLYHIGGLKALELQGFAHYLLFGDENKMTLYGENNFPAWLKNIDISNKVVLYKKPYFDSIGLKKISSNIQEYEITISTPERAIFELLYLVEVDGMSFEFVAEIFEGLTTLRPNLINELLAKCESKKVLRLFCFLMDFYNHQWKKFVKIDDIEFGSGKMQIVKGGIMDKKYLITIPKGFTNESK